MWCYLTAVRAPVWDAPSLLSQGLSWFFSGFVPDAHPHFLHPSSPLSLCAGSVACLGSCVLFCPGFLTERCMWCHADSVTSSARVAATFGC